MKKELPKESEKFVIIDKEVKVILMSGEATKIAVTFCNTNNVFNRLEEV